MVCVWGVGGGEWVGEGGEGEEEREGREKGSRGKRKGEGSDK